MPFSGSYISDIDGRRFSLTVTDKELRKKIKAIGGKRFSYLFGSLEDMVIHFDTEEEKVRVMQNLIDMEDIYFMHWEHSWPPSAIAEIFREKGLVHGEIRRVVQPMTDRFRTYVD